MPDANGYDDEMYSDIPPDIPTPTARYREPGKPLEYKFNPNATYKPKGRFPRRDPGKGFTPQPMRFVRPPVPKMTDPIIAKMVHDFFKAISHR